MTDLTPEGLRVLASDFMYAEFYPQDPMCSDMMTGALAVAFTTLVAEARLGSPLREYVVVQAHDKTGGKGVIVCRSELDVGKAVGAMLDVGFTEVRCTKDSAIRAQEETP